jgi:hypothetical protein
MNITDPDCGLRADAPPGTIGRGSGMTLKEFNRRLSILASRRGVQTIGDTWVKRWRNRPQRRLLADARKPLTDIWAHL